jgi:hypothetical protein
VKVPKCSFKKCKSTSGSSRPAQVCVRGLLGIDSCKLGWVDRGNAHAPCPCHCLHYVQMTAVLKNYACAERKQTNATHTHMQHRNCPVGFDPLHFSAESCGIASRSHHNVCRMGHAGRGPCDARIEGRIHRRKINPGLRQSSHSNARCM